MGRHYLQSTDSFTAETNASIATYSKAYRTPHWPSLNTKLQGLYSATAGVVTLYSVTCRRRGTHEHPKGGFRPSKEAPTHPN